MIFKCFVVLVYLGQFWTLAYHESKYQSQFCFNLFRLGGAATDLLLILRDATFR